MDSEILAEIEHGTCRLQAVCGDMTDEAVDAIVNAANSRLLHGGGLAGAIVAKGGAVIQEESDRIAPVAVGAAAATPAGDLPCRWVIHAVGPIWGQGDEERLLRSAVASSLRCAHDLGARSISIPAISTGIFGYPKADGVAVICSEAKKWLRDHPETTITRLRFTAFDDETATLFAAALAAG